MGKLSAAHYKILAIKPNGHTSHRTVQGAPTESRQIAFGRAVSAAFVARYDPSKKGWRLLDIRNVTEITPAGTRVRWYRGQVRGVRYYPTEDAAIMRAIAALGV